MLSSHCLPAHGKVTYFIRRTRVCGFFFRLSLPTQEKERERGEEKTAEIVVALLLAVKGTTITTKNAGIADDDDDDDDEQQQ